MLATLLLCSAVTPHTTYQPPHTTTTTIHSSQRLQIKVGG
jgi:hypothetical protein